jgi:hypothetical protein
MTQTQGTELYTKPIEAALEWSKQITTLATGTLVLSGTFIQLFFENTLVQKGWILVSWILMGTSIVFGITYLGALCSLLAYAADSSASNEDISIYNQPGLTIAIIHVFAWSSPEASVISSKKLHPSLTAPRA